jgi:hypothetical protein
MSDRKAYLDVCDTCQHHDVNRCPLTDEEQKEMRDNCAQLLVDICDDPFLKECREYLASGGQELAEFLVASANVSFHKQITLKTIEGMGKSACMSDRCAAAAVATNGTYQWFRSPRLSAKEAK